MRFYPKSPVGAFADACIEVVGVRERLIHLPLVMRIARKSNIESIIEFEIRWPEQGGTSVADAVVWSEHDGEKRVALRDLHGKRGHRGKCGQATRFNWSAKCKRGARRAIYRPLWELTTSLGCRMAAKAR